MSPPLKRRVATLVVASTAAASVLAGNSPSYAATGTGSWAGQVAGTSVKVRAGASSGTAKVGTAARWIVIQCQVRGQKIRGRVRTTDLWDRIGNGRYVSDAYVRHAKVAIPICPAPTPVPAVNAGTVTWIRPVPAGGFGGFRTVQRPDHDGVDLSVARNTPIKAAAAGTVVTVTCNTSGLSCDVDGSPAIRGCGWYVEVQHEGPVVTRYCHMVRRPEVIVGQRVTLGQIIGYVGTSGSSSGPHLHFEVHAGAPATRLNAIDPVAFMAARSAPIA
jgi:murein DD-endopeptidase MepM/ murein hydrolase activator NlpD